MIRFRPNVRSVSAAMKDEQVFDSVDDMMRYLHEAWSHVVEYMGSEDPFRMEEITVDNGRSLYTIDLANTHKVCVARMKDKQYSVPICIGFYGE